MRSTREVKTGLGPMEFDGVSRPAQSHYTHWLYPTMQVISGKILPRVLHWDNRSPHGPSPRAFHLLNIPLGGKRPVALFQSLDKKTEVNALRLKQGKSSDRLLDTDGDQVWFVAGGNGFCDTTIGRIYFDAPAYVYIPLGFIYRIHANTETIIFGIESASPFEKSPPHPHLPNIPFSDSDLLTPAIDGRVKKDTPDLNLHRGEAEEPTTPAWKIWIKRAGVWSSAWCSDTPFSCVGYEGYPYPFVLPANKILFPDFTLGCADPTMLMTFVSSQKERGMPCVGISTFLPSVHLPRNFHTTLYDEIRLIVREDSADAVLRDGDISFHPRGFAQGPREDIAPNANTHAIVFTSQNQLAPTSNIPSRAEISDYLKSL